MKSFHPQARALLPYMTHIAKAAKFRNLRTVRLVNVEEATMSNFLMNGVLLMESAPVTAIVSISDEAAVLRNLPLAPRAAACMKEIS